MVDSIEIAAIGNEMPHSSATEGEPVGCSHSDLELAAVFERGCAQGAAEEPAGDWLSGVQEDDQEGLQWSAGARAAQACGDHFSGMFDVHYGADLDMVEAADDASGHGAGAGGRGAPPQAEGIFDSLLAGRAAGGPPGPGPLGLLLECSQSMLDLAAAALAAASARRSGRSRSGSVRRR